MTVSSLTTVQHSQDGVVVGVFVGVCVRVCVGVDAGAAGSTRAGTARS